MSDHLPLLLQPEELAALKLTDKQLVVDLSEPDNYAQHHIAGAVSLPYAEIIAAKPPAMGLLPEAAQFHASLQRLGIDADTHIIACDDEGGGRSARFIWSLHAYGHMNCSQLDGGMTAWLAEGYPVTAAETPVPTASDYAPARIAENVCEAEYIMSRLGADDLGLLDARSLPEYSGDKVLANRGGHIPGAARYEWTDCMDRSRNLRLLPEVVLREELEARGLTSDKEIIVYCQTHHRSALSYVMLKNLGYERVRGYHGAWSDWGNREDTPVEL